MTAFNKAYLDTAPIIYYLEDILPYAEVMHAFLLQGIKNNVQFFTSTVTNMEFLVQPIKQNNKQVIDDFTRFKNLLNIKTISVNDDIAIAAAKIRAKYESIKGMDALHLASAIQNKCTIFLTNDKQLKQVTEIQCVLMDEV